MQKHNCAIIWVAISTLYSSGVDLKKWENSAPPSRPFNSEGLSEARPTKILYA